jgi:N-acetylglucosamine kinase-like BadF-type ATPase
MIYLCVDGGQTKTAVALLEEDGTRIQAWQTRPLTTPSKPDAVDNLRLMVSELAEELRRRLASSGSDLPKIACFSLSGYLEGDELVPSIVSQEMRRTLPETEKIQTVPDYVGNWAAATRGEPGIVVISGGGAVAYGRTASGDSLRVGGWGHLLGDEGSGYWIGLEAIKTALRSWAGVIPKTALEARVMETLGAEDDRQVLSRVYSGSLSEAEIAGLVLLVASLARNGDESADRIIEEAAYYLVSMADAVLKRLGELPIYLSGGTFGVAPMPERFERSLAGLGKDTQVITVVSDPLEGVFLIAKEGIQWGYI